MNWLSKKNIYRLFLLALTCLAVFLLFRMAPIFTKPGTLLSDDFVRFWASGKLILEGENPYDALKIAQLQIAEGSPASVLSTSSIMLNPPWMITLLMPFGLLDYATSRLVWLLLSATVILISTQLLWRIYAGDIKLRWIALLFGFIFAPTISVLEKGQVTVLLVLGIVGFLYFTAIDNNDWLAGISLALVSIKPQTLILFWIVAIFWVIQQHRWVIPISAAITVLSLVLIAMLFNPRIISQYSEMLQTYQISAWAVPTIGAYLRYFWFGLDHIWLQFLPSLIGGIWVFYYWIKHQKSWNWVVELPIVLLITQLTSPYSWTYDLVILLPAIILAATWMSQNKKTWAKFLLVVLFLVINISDLILHMKLDEFWFLWLAPVYFIWYLLVRWQFTLDQTKQTILVSAN